ncbi:MAG: VOC family protein [Candidatus Sericytochromatia bacterium]
MSHITGIGGIFFKARNPEALRVWYSRHLGISFEEWGGSFFRWDGQGSTTFALFKQDTDYFAPGTASFMINFRVKDLAGLLAQLRTAGVQVEDKQETSELGTFAWILDPEGNKVELWEPGPGC